MPFGHVFLRSLTYFRCGLLGFIADAGHIIYVLWVNTIVDSSRLAAAGMRTSVEAV
jgi:hypothetical protein